METRTIVLLGAAALGVTALAVAIPVGRALYLDAPHFAPDVNGLAVRVYGQIASGKLNRSLYAKEFNDAYTPAVLAAARPEFATLGMPTDLTLQYQGAAPGGTKYLFSAHYPAGDHQVELLLTPDGKVGNFRLKP